MPFDLGLQRSSIGFQIDLDHIDLFGSFSFVFGDLQLQFADAFEMIVCLLFISNGKQQDF